MNFTVSIFRRASLAYARTSSTCRPKPISPSGSWRMTSGGEKGRLAKFHGYYYTRVSSVVRNPGGQTHPIYRCGTFGDLFTSQETSADIEIENIEIILYRVLIIILLYYRIFDTDNFNRNRAENFNRTHTTTSSSAMH